MLEDALKYTRCVVEARKRNNHHAPAAEKDDETEIEMLGIKLAIKRMKKLIKEKRRKLR